MILLKKRKDIEYQLKDVRNKLGLIGKQIGNLEQMIDQKEFIEAVDKNNQLLRELQSKMDLQVIDDAIYINKEIDLHNEQIQQMLESAMNDQEIQMDYQQIQEKVSQEDKKVKNVQERQKSKELQFA